MKRIFENLKVAFKSINSNKLRTFLTMLGIIIGVGAVVAVMSVGAGAEASITANLQSMGTNVITISPGRGMPGGAGGMMRELRQGGQAQEEVVEGDLYFEDVSALKKEATLLNEIAPVLQGRSSTIAYMSWSGDASVTGTTQDFLSVQGYTMAEGSFITESDVSNLSNVAVIGSTIADDYFGKIDPVGEVIKIDGKNFTVVGLLETIGSSGFGSSPDETVYIPITTAHYKLFGGPSEIDSIVAKLKDENQLDSAMAEVKSILRIEHKIYPSEPNDFQISSPTQFLETASSITNILSYTLAGIAAISLLVGGIGIMNIMFVSVTERTREIGIRKAIGAKNRDILIQFLTESIILSLSGGLIGVGFAYLISWLLKTLGSLSSLITATPIILALSFSTGIGLIFGIFPAMRAARLKPIESLRYE
jgi:putative ABC transport system permease protein